MQTDLCAWSEKQLENAEGFAAAVLQGQQEVRRVPIEDLSIEAYNVTVPAAEVAAKMLDSLKRKEGTGAKSPSWQNQTLGVPAIELCMKLAYPSPF